MRKPWRRKGPRAASTLLVKVGGESARLNRRTRYWYALPLKANLGNFRCWRRMDLLFVPLPEPARGPPEWKIPRWTEANEIWTESWTLSLRAGPIEIHLAEASTLPENVLREPVSRDWPLVCFELLARCPEAEDRQGMVDLAVLNTFLEVASLSGPLRFWTEAEKETRWRSLCPEAPRVAERSTEGTEGRRAPYTEVCTALPQKGLPPQSPKS